TIFFVGEKVVQRAVVWIAATRGFANLKHMLGGVLGCRILRELLDQAEQLWSPGEIVMRQRNLLQRSLGVAGEDQAKVSQFPNDEFGDVSKGLLQIERTGEHFARLGEEGQVTLAAF